MAMPDLSWLFNTSICILLLLCWLKSWNTAFLCELLVLISLKYIHLSFINGQYLIILITSHLTVSSSHTLNIICSLNWLSPNKTILTFKSSPFQIILTWKILGQKLIPYYIRFYSTYLPHWVNSFHLRWQSRLIWFKFLLNWFWINLRLPP